MEGRWRGESNKEDNDKSDNIDLKSSLPSVSPPTMYLYGVLGGRPERVDSDPPSVPSLVPLPTDNLCTGVLLPLEGVEPCLVWTESLGPEFRRP